MKTAFELLINAAQRGQDFGAANADTVKYDSIEDMVATEFNGTVFYTADEVSVIIQAVKVDALNIMNGSKNDFDLLAIEPDDYLTK